MRHIILDIDNETEAVLVVCSSVLNIAESYRCTVLSLDNPSIEIIRLHSEHREHGSHGEFPLFNLNRSLRYLQIASANIYVKMKII